MKNLHLETIAAVFLIIAGLNAGVNAVFDTNIVGNVLDGGISTAFYAIVGLSAVWALAARVGIVGSED